MEYEEVKVPGGRLYIEKGYGDIDIPVSFNFVSEILGIKILEL